MEKFSTFTSIVAPLDRANVDTDAIIPKQFLKSIARKGFGPYLFDEWRYLDHGEPGMDCSDRPRNPDFILHQAAYRHARILLTRENFGCGSSREHAPWALLDYGFKVIIAPSYADIFFNNCFKNGILPVILPQEQIAALFDQTKQEAGLVLTVDLDQQQLHDASGRVYAFAIDAFRKHCLQSGLDDIALTLAKTAKIKAYEEKNQVTEPWLFKD